MSDTIVQETEKPFRVGTNIAVRSNIIIDAKYDLTGKENDIIDMLLTEIEKDDKLEYEISLKKYKQYYQVKDEGAIYKNIKDAVKSIGTKRIYSNKIDSNDSYAWFPKIKYKDNKGIILIELHKDIKKAMVECKSVIYYNIKYTLPLQNNYAKRYYYYCKQFQDTGYLIQKLEDVKEKLEVDTRYPLFSDFKRFVLMPSVEQINERTDIKIRMNYLSKDKTNIKKITHIEVFISKKTENEKNNINVKRRDTKLEHVRVETMKLYENLKGDKKESDLKKEIAEKLNTSIKTVSRYIKLSKELIDPLIEMLDNKEISIAEAMNWAKENKENQSSNIEKIKILAELKAKKKNTKIIKEKKNTKVIKENKKIIDVEYKEVNGIIDSDNQEHTKIQKATSETIDKTKQILQELNVNDKQAKIIYDNSNRDFEYISYIYEELKNVPQLQKIENPVGWLIEMVKPNVYKAPIMLSKKKLNFNNFEGRKLSAEEYKKLEEQLTYKGVGSEEEINNGIEEEAFQDDKNISLETNNNIERETFIGDKNISLEIIKFKNILENQLEAIFGEVSYKTWMKYGVEKLYIENNKLKYPCINDFTVDIINKRYSSTILEIAKVTIENITEIEAFVSI